MERKRLIVITPEEDRYLQKTFKVSKTTVWQAVRYIRDNDIHRRIRKFAIERGNPQMVLSPEFDTLYLTNREDADGKMSRYMIQTFENGATLEANMTTGRVEVHDKYGRIACSGEHMKIEEITAMQEVAQAL